MQTETIHEPYRVVEPGLIGGVCCVCFPGDTLFNLFPDLRGNLISHGYCPRHFNRLMEELQLTKPTQN